VQWSYAEGRQSNPDAAGVKVEGGKSMADASTDSRQRLSQPLAIRVSHWINIPLLLIMAGSGLQIFSAYPALGPRGAQYAWYPLQNVVPPRWATFGRWLAGARHWHFAVAWFLMLNGIIYLIFFFASGEWHRRLFLPRRDAASAIHMFAFYIRALRTPPPTDFYNGLQRLAYTSVILFAIIEVLSGLAIYKPLQLWWLATIFGGYDSARAIHLGMLALIAVFVVMHLVLVILHPRTILDMVTGGERG